MEPFTRTTQKMEFFWPYESQPYFCLPISYVDLQSGNKHIGVGNHNHPSHSRKIFFGEFPAIIPEEQ
ncbi:MAG: hypothetical protein O3A65_07715 [Proteobacteria bacterium]|nr:hypothetical protein [Pseudomonadota bacterium]